MMKRLIIESWLLLVYFDWVMRFRTFEELHRIVRDEQIRPTTRVQMAPSEELCRAVDHACVLYFKRVLCLQRSSATTLLLRRHGWKAEMVIGAQMLPFKSHAWCEIDGMVVNDRPYAAEIYAVLERC
jgi:hypothetical protein